MRHTLLWATAVWLWTVSIGMGTAGVILAELRLTYGSLMVALVGCLVSCYLFVQCIVRAEVSRAVREERVRLETLVEAMLLRARERVDEESRVRSIRH